MDPNAFAVSASFEPLEIIAQPYLTSKLRYRSDYQRMKTRLGVLRSQNNSNFQRPTIAIPQAYLNVSQQYCIRVCLVTIINEQTNCRYIHPYDLEDICFDEHNNRDEKVVIFPIGFDDRYGIKSFPNLRIVKKKADELKTHGGLRVFDSPNSPSIPQLSTSKETITEFNLDRFQLSFTLGKKELIDGISTITFYACTTQFSDEMVENPGRGADVENPTSRGTTSRSHTSKPILCQIHNYAPRQGYTDGNDEILMFFNNRLRGKKYREGDLQVTFEYHTADIHWSASVLDLEVRDRMISFRTPPFPYPMAGRTTVDVVLKQETRTFEPLQFDYISRVDGSQSQWNATISRDPIAPTNPNKRSITEVYDEQTDDPVHPETIASNFSGMLEPDWFLRE